MTKRIVHYLFLIGKLIINYNNVKTNILSEANQS